MNVEEVKAQARLAIGRQLAEARAAAGLTTRKLAELSGVPHSSITRIERGGHNPSVEVLAQILEPLESELRVLPKQ